MKKINAWQVAMTVLILAIFFVTRQLTGDVKDAVHAAVFAGVGLFLAIELFFIGWHIVTRKHKRQTFAVHGLLSGRVVFSTIGIFAAGYWIFVDVFSPTSQLYTSSFVVALVYAIVATTMAGLLAFLYIDMYAERMGISRTRLIQASLAQFVAILLPMVYAIGK